MTISECMFNNASKLRYETEVIGVWTTALWTKTWLVLLQQNCIFVILKSGA